MVPGDQEALMKPETQARLEQVAQSDALLYDTGTLIDTERAWTVIACEDASLRGKTADDFARWLRLRRPLYRLADVLALLEQLPALKAQYETSARRRAAAKAAHPRAATVRAKQTRQATEQAIAGFDAGALALLERFRRLHYPRAAAVRAIQQKPHDRLIALLDRVEAAVQAGTMYHPAAYLAAALEE